MGDTSHRLIQPAPLPPRRGPPGPPGPSRQLVKKPGPTTSPCETCRQYKIKCDGKRPVCTPCETRNRNCNYTRAPDETRSAALKRKYDQLEEEAKSLRSTATALKDLMSIIRSRDADDAASIFERIRRGADPEAIVKSVRDGDLLLQLQVSPEARFRYVFPLQRKMPAYIQTLARPYLSSLLFEATTELFFKPYHAASIVDARLDAITPSRWTNVCDDDNLMRVLIRLYYQHEYQFLTCFHMGAFLDDMLSGTDRFCSSVLVNAVLAHACHCHLDFPKRFEHWNPDKLGHKFFAEAKRQFDEQVVNKTDSITLVQAAMVLNGTLNMHSPDKLGVTVTLHGVAVAHNLGLFESPPEPRSQICQRVYDFTAWNLYWWTSLECYQLFHDPWIINPPKTPLPDPKADPTWYGETWVQYASSPTPVRVTHGYVCKAKGELSRIINALAARLYKSKDGPTASNALSIDMIFDFSPRLQHWFSSLSACLNSAHIAFPSQLELHQLYHNLMVNVCEMSVVDKDEAPNLQSGQRIDSMLAHSRACFEALVRLYYLRHGHSADGHSYLTHPLTVLAFIALAQLGTAGSPAPAAAPTTSPTIDNARSALILAGQGLHDQAKNYYTSLAIFHLIFSKMSEEDRGVLLTRANLDKESETVARQRAKYVQAQYPIGVMSIVDHPEKGRLESLVKEFAGLAAEEQSPAQTREATPTAA